ncbi:NADPH-dependent F420 reductase [Haliangium sp. UPWRP_2]|uniref:NADPH-dependent F420 reductase n=1 Tax=Haliangium sp. UPWRP_2 TaxID=1931276 RepID=UPI000D0C9D3D|nr:NADPH-dependent F420 reductase [Haliangium sp. UPWRP_2]PSM30836.1 hypothetical protein BVG81_008475 [Haliangium sp. UPWRP_2]HNN96111.1 NADPH-dependent F420 reductase [Pseudomonadota bacterium]
MKIAFIGYGQVGSALADQLQRRGHTVTLAAHRPDSDSVKAALGRNGQLQVAAPAQAVAEADVVFVATPFAAAAEALAAVSGELSGKILVDCTNPVGPGLSHGLGSAASGSERLQAQLPNTQVVKAFTIYGFENFENNVFPGHDVKPVMMFCGRDAAAKAKVGGLIAELGWEPLDVGGLEQALHLEHMTLLWVRMVRVHQHSPHMVWAVLKR